MTGLCEGQCLQVTQDRRTRKRDPGGGASKKGEKGECGNQEACKRNTSEKGR